MSWVSTQEVLNTKSEQMFKRLKNKIYNSHVWWSKNIKNR